MATTDRRATTLALAHALSAAERGLAVIPLARTKLPALRSPHRHDPGPEPFTCHGECGRFGHGVHDASTDPARIRALFAAAPWATGYGIACGLPPHHLIGIDLDTRPGDTRSGDTRPGDAEPDSSTALRELALRHLFTIPPTVVVLTPSGGRHLWLTGPTDHVVPNSAGRLAPGIDVRGAGGYLVGPGSRTRHGAYTTAPGTAHLAPAPCPPALLRLLLPPPVRRGGGGPATGGSATGGSVSDGAGTGGAGTGGAVAGRVVAGGVVAGGRGLVQFVLAAHEGQRNTRLFWAACRAYENGIGPALLTPLLEAARATGLTEREARATLASAARMTGHHP